MQHALLYTSRCCTQFQLVHMNEKATSKDKWLWNLSRYYSQIEMTDQENQVDENNYEQFLSDETIPESLPEEFPGITKFSSTEPSAGLQFDGGDIVLVNSLANLAPRALADEMKAMHLIACHLAIGEEQEKTRGKILRVLLDRD